MAIDHFKKHFHGTDSIDWNYNILFNNQPHVTKIAQEYSKILNPKNLYPPIPGRWLHITILRVGLTTEFTQEEMLSINKELKPNLKNIEMPKMVFGPPVILDECPVLRVIPEEPLNRLFELVLSAAANVVGAQRAPKLNKFTPHMTLAYTKASEKDTGIGNVDFKVPIDKAEFRAESLCLLKQKPAGSYYKWDIIEKLPIGR